MGNINKFRPLNGGRNTVSRNGPSFLVCALFIGLCIVTVSYYNLSSQYTKMYDTMTDLVQQQKLLEKHLEKQKSEELKGKLKEQKSIENLQETKVQLEKKIKELNEAKLLNAKAREDIMKKAQELVDAQARIKELETLKAQLNEEIVKQKEQIDELNKKLFPNKNQSDINLQDKGGLDPKRKIVDTNQLNQPNDSKDILLAKENKAKDDDKNVSKATDTKHDPIVKLLNKDKNQSS